MLSRLSSLAAVCLTLVTSTSHAQSPTAPCSSEPTVESTLNWFPPQRGVWTPVGWKDHLFRFTSAYNGTFICGPAGVLPKPHTAKYQGQEFQLAFHPSTDGAIPAMPPARQKFYRIDGGVGVQSYREDKVAPVLRTDWPCQEGLVMRQEVFAHMQGGQAVTTAMEPLFGWMRLSVAHVDPVRAPKTFNFGVHLSQGYMRVGGGAGLDDTAWLEAAPDLAPLSTPLTSADLPGDAGTTPGLRILQNEKIRLQVMPGGQAKLTLTDSTTGTYNLNIELPVVEGAYVDLLIPMLLETESVMAAEAALGYEGALADTEKFWEQTPATAAVIRTPEKYINEALKRNIQFAEIIAELNPDNGEYTFLSGTHGYDQLWSTPTSMVSHMFLDLLGYHDVVKRHVALYKPNQGTLKPPGDAYTTHSGYFSTPKTLTALDWLTDHGAVMEVLARHALLTGDQAFTAHWTEPLLRACDFIVDSCASTTHTGVKGVMPPAVATDSLIAVQAVWNQAWTYKGLATTVELLESIKHPRTAELQTFAAGFREKFEAGFRAETAKQPKWKAPDGSSHPVLPAGLIPFPVYHIYDDAFLLDTGPLVLPWAGLMEAADPLMTSFADYFRVGPPTKLWGPRSSAIARAVLIHELSTCEPCYSWNIVNSWKTGDRAKFLEGMYALFTGAISTQTYINCEHRNGMFGNLFVAPLMTWCLRQAVIDDQLAANELHLLRLCPLAWISATEETRFLNMPTVYGPVDLKWQLSGDGKVLDLTAAARWRNKPGKVELHIPPVPGLQTIRVNGTEMSAANSIPLNL